MTDDDTTGAIAPATAAAREVLSDLPRTMRWQEDLYQDLHRHPELSLQETRTNRIIADRLAHWGYDVLEVGGGVVGVLRNGDGPCVLFRADTDALPVQEDTGLPYSSTVDGVMHACGHDLHITWALGAAQLLATHQGAWSGTYVALFQPAEETAEGAQAMVDAGLVDRVPRPDVALGQHVMPARAGLVSSLEDFTIGAWVNVRYRLVDITPAFAADKILETWVRCRPAPRAMSSPIAPCCSSTSAATTRRCGSAS